MEEQITNRRIKEILTKEKVQMEGEYKHGKIYLTENYLLWEKKKKFDSAIIPLKSIQEIKESIKFGVGGCVKVIYGDNKKEKIFALQEGSFGQQPEDDIKSLITMCKTGTHAWVSPRIWYQGGHSTYSE